jgi:hypothetical protein
MAPPDLYAVPAQPGLMTPRTELHVHAPEISLCEFLWAVAAVLAAILLAFELAPS